MQKAPEDDQDHLSVEDINKLEDQRIDRLNEAEINELDILGHAQEDFNNWQNYFNENETRGKDDVNFVIRDQWTAIERSEFTRLFKPAMVFNKLYDACKKVAGEQRKDKPDLLVRSLNGEISQEQIDLREDLIRTICYQSQNDLIYQSAFRSALMMGWGAFEVALDYESPTSFNYVVNFNLIPDAAKCSWDPKAIKPHKGDGNFCGRSHLFSRKEFEATFPYITNAVSYNDPRTLLDFQWEMRDALIVADYFKKEWFPTIIYKLSNGMSVTKDEWEKMQPGIKMRIKLASDSNSDIRDIINNEIPKIVRERQSQDYKIMQYRLLKDQIIDFSEWPSKQLPIIFVDGDSYYVDGKQYTKSFIHEARDAQKFINYVGSEIAAEIKNRRREQWIGTADNVIGNEQMWRNPELQNGILIAKVDPKTGQLPQKMNPWDMSQELMANFQRGTNDIREILGFQDENPASAQATGNAMSGKAFNSRQMVASMSSYVFRDNLNQAIEQAGRVVLDLLPVIAGNDPRPMTVNRKDGKSQTIIFNQEMPDGSIVNKLELGEFDVEIDTGPSFAVQKESSVQLLLQLASINPNVFPLVADLIAKNLDVQFMPQIAERFQTLVPPQILAKEQGQPPPPPQPNPQEQMMQMEMQVKQMEMKNQMAQIQERAHELQIREKKHELEKLEIVLKAQEMQDRMKMDKIKHVTEAHTNAKDRDIEMHKAELDYSGKLAKIMADMHTSKNKESTTES